MLCDVCQEKEATIYYTEIINGEKREQKLCENCAAEHSEVDINAVIFNKEFPFASLLSGLLGGSYNVDEHEQHMQAPKKVCEYCGMTEDEFLNNGKFGCSACYSAFGLVLSKSIKKIQNGDKHIGKSPKGYITKTKKIVNELTDVQKLAIRLQEAIEKEEFEEAAKLRDELKAMKEESGLNA